MLAWRSVRLHAAGTSAGGALRARSATGCAALSMKAVIAAATMTPMTQVLASCALADGHHRGALAERPRTATVGGFVAFITAHAAADRRRSSTCRRSPAPITRGLAALDTRRRPDRRRAGRARRHASTRAARAATIELRGVTLALPRRRSAPALDRIDLEHRAGETVALVGPSGAGKTTLVNLLPRFIEPTSGNAAARRHAARRLGRRRAAPPVRAREPGRRRCSTTASPPTSRSASAPTAPTATASACAARCARANLLEFAEALPQRPRHRRRPQRQRVLGRPAPAPGDRPRDLQGRADPDPRRGDLGARLGVGAARPAGAREADERPHQPGHRAPPVDHRARRPHRRHRRRPHRRSRAAMPSCSPPGGLYARLHALQFRG